MDWEIKEPTTIEEANEMCRQACLGLQQLIDDILCGKVKADDDLIDKLLAEIKRTNTFQ